MQELQRFASLIKGSFPFVDAATCAVAIVSNFDVQYSIATMNRQQNFFYQVSNRGPGGILLPLLFVAGFLFVAYYLIRGLLTILSVLAPFLLIATLIVDRQVILDYVQFIGTLLRERLLVGIIAIVLSVVAFPILCGVLFGRALIRRNLRGSRMEQREADYVEYTEVDDDEDFLELPEQQPRRRDDGNRSDYDQLFN